jgi:hypothetical protein
MVQIQFHICNYEWAKILFVDTGLGSRLQHSRPYKISQKKWKSSHLNCNGHIEGDIMQNHEKTKVKKSEKPRFYGKVKLFS